MKTKNMMVGILAGVLVVALWYTMLLKPVRAKTSKVKADTANQQSRLSPLESQLARARNDAAHVDKFDAQLKSLQQAMPNSPALAAFIRDANNIAAASGVAWQSVTHGPPTPGNSGSMSITVGIQVKGTYAQVLDYLSRVVALRRLVVVDSVALSTAGTSGAGGANEPSGDRPDRSPALRNSRRRSRPACSSRPPRRRSWEAPPARPCPPLPEEARNRPPRRHRQD